MSTQIDIVIPVYNEGETITHVYEHLTAALEQKLTWRAFFIYDFDQDITVPYLKALQEKDDRVIPVKQTYGKGVVNALKFGFLEEVHDGAVLVVMGDDSDDLESIPQMFEAYQKGAAVVASSRHSKGGEYHGGVFLKKQLSKLAGKLLDLSGLGTKDPTNNFKLYSGKFLKNADIKSKAGFEIALELTVKASLKGLKVTEIPGKWKDREVGESKFRLFKWLPHYLYWFCYYFYHKVIGYE